MSWIFSAVMVLCVLCSIGVYLLSEPPAKKEVDQVIHPNDKRRLNDIVAYSQIYEPEWKLKERA